MKKFSLEGARDFICNRLKIKPINVSFNNGDFYVRRFNTLQRIINFLHKKDHFESRYTNTLVIINEINSHYWIDIWVNDDLLTIRCNK